MAASMCLPKLFFTRLNCVLLWYFLSTVVPHSRVVKYWHKYPKIFAQTCSFFQVLSVTECIVSKFRLFRSLAITRVAPFAWGKLSVVLRKVSVQVSCPPYVSKHIQRLRDFWKLKNKSHFQHVHVQAQHTKSWVSIFYTQSWYFVKIGLYI